MKQRQPSAKTRQTGYTLIELLLYVVIVGALLTSVVYFLSTTLDARVKNQSISEVDDQGTAIMDYITQTIRNATSITTPAAAGSGSTLTLVVPTGSLSPTTFSISASGSGTDMGRDTQGSLQGNNFGNKMTAVKVIAPATGTVSNLFAFTGNPAGSGNNQAQMAIYSGTTDPTTLLASSATVSTANTAWTTFPISPVSVTSGQTYWIAYNTFNAGAFFNTLYSDANAAVESRSAVQTYGTWPGSWTGSAANNDYSLYGVITAGGAGSGALQVAEGAGSPVLLSSGDVTMSSLTFKNLTASGTAGIVQVSFTLARTNFSGRNPYDYQKTFVSSAEIGW